MDLSIHLPVAGTSVPLLLLFGIGLFVGGLSGFFGVSAGFLLTPLLITIGIPPAVAAASCANQCVAASTPGAFAHLRHRTFDGRMLLLLLAGAVVGGTLGVQILDGLAAAGLADFSVRFVYVLLLFGLGAHMLTGSLRELRGEGATVPGAAREARSMFVRRILDRLPLRIGFPASGVTHSAIVPIVLGLAVGLLTAFAGIGGGIALLPATAVLLGLPIHLAMGTVLVHICLSSLNVTVQHALVNHTVDVVLALVLFIGAVLGARVGIRAGRRLKADQLRILLAIIVLFAGAKLALDLLLPPEVTSVVVRAEAVP